MASSSLPVQGAKCGLRKPSLTPQVLSCAPYVPVTWPRTAFLAPPAASHTSPSLLKRPLTPARGGVLCRDSVFESVETALSTGAVIGSLVGITYSAVVTSALPKKANDEDNFVWGLMGFISVLPLFNWLAWVFAALQGERSALYYTYAGIYALPLLMEGFDLDKYAFLMLALCIAHVQVERIAQTEPEVLQQFKPIALISGLVRGAAGSSASYVSEVSRTVVSDTRQVLQARKADRQLGPGETRGTSLEDWTYAGKKGQQQGQPLLRGDEDGSSSEVEEYEQVELDRFDRQLRERERRRRREQQQQQQQRGPQ